MLGVGETIDNPASQSLIADYYKPTLRGRAYAFQRVAPTVGTALGTILGGVVAAVAGWRWAFLLVGVPGSLLAVVVWRLPEPRRGEHDVLVEGSGEVALGEAESAFAGGNALPADDGEAVAEGRRGREGGVGGRAPGAVGADVALSHRRHRDRVGRARGHRLLGADVLLAPDVAHVGTGRGRRRRPDPRGRPRGDAARWFPHRSVARPGRGRADGGGRSHAGGGRAVPHGRVPPDPARGEAADGGDRCAAHRGRVPCAHRDDGRSRAGRDPRPHLLA